MTEGQNTAEREKSFMSLLFPSHLLMTTAGDKTQVRFLAYRLPLPKYVSSLLQELQV